MAQADGYYPRLNAAMLQSGKYTNMIVSLMGRIQNDIRLGEPVVDFLTSDGGTVKMNVESAELADTMDIPMNERPVMEAIGQALDDNTVAVSIRNIVLACHFNKKIEKCRSALFFCFLISSTFGWLTAKFKLLSFFFIPCSYLSREILPTIPIWKSTIKCWQYSTIPNLPLILLH